MRSLSIVALLCVGCAHAAATAPQPVRRQQPLHEDLAERGQELAQRGEDLRAEQYLAGALESGADVDVVLPRLLRVCVASERYEAALMYAERFQPAPGTNLQLDLVLAGLQLGLGQVERARKNLEQILDVKDEPQAHYMLGRLYAGSLQDFEAADRHYRKYLALAPDGAHATEARRSLLKTTVDAPMQGSGKSRPREVKP